MSTIARPSTRTIRIRLSTPMRKTVLMIHIVSAVAWIGIDVVMAMLIFTALFSEDAFLEMINYGALSVVIFWPLITTAVLSLASGLMLGCGSKYGVVRYWWVLIKLILNLLLGTLVIFALNPTLISAGEFARAMAMGGHPDETPLKDLIYPPIVSTTAMLFASFLSVFKPWGRIRRQVR